MWSIEDKDGIIITLCNLCKFEINATDVDREIVYSLMKAHIQNCPGRGK